MNWTWISGSDTKDQYGNYGSLGIAASSKDLSARNGAISWISSNDILYLFGGSVGTSSTG